MTEEAVSDKPREWFHQTFLKTSKDWGQRAGLTSPGLNRFKCKGPTLGVPSEFVIKLR